MKAIGCIVIVLMALAITEASAASPEQAVSLVKKAVAYERANGRENTVNEINKRTGPFVIKDSDLYVFAYDLYGKLVAHPYNKTTLGMNLFSEPDAKGKMYRKDIVETTRKQGKGWVDYYNRDSKSGKSG